MTTNSNQERMFRVIYEKNYKENELFIHYCQYTGNEAQMDRFCAILNHASFDDVDGDVIHMFTAMKKLVPESAVDAHIGLDDPNGYARLFQKHTGTFTCPEFEVMEDYDEQDNRIDKPLHQVDRYQLGHEINGQLYSTQIRYCFSDYKPIW